MSCKIENLTIDATVYGEVMQVPTFEGGSEYVAGSFRQPHVDSIFCSEHGYLMENMTDGAHLDINSIVQEHLDGENNGNNNSK